ncbi:MAG: DNA recombination protein RmuC [Planctomycetota bacterium]
MEWLMGILGLLVGGIIGSLAAVAKFRTATAVAAQRADAATEDAKTKAADVEQWRDLAKDADTRAARLEEQLAAEKQNLDQQRKLLTDAEAKLKETFAGMAERSLGTSNERFLDMAKARFDTDAEKRKLETDALLKPLREQLEAYRTRLAEAEKQREDDKAKIVEQLGKVAEGHAKLGVQTTQLVTALSKPTTRGRWGELQLERLVEMAGLNEHFDFTTQAHVNGDESAARPDMVVTMPGDRTIIIDAKTPGEAFMDAVECTDPEQRDRLLAVHAKKLSEHATTLGQKAYWNRFDRTPEFVVMFVPAEALLYAAVDKQPGLIEKALQNKVILATPTTLIALLRTVELGWRQQRAAENAEEIRLLGVELHNRLRVFAEHFHDVGRSLDKSVASYNKAVSSMDRNLATTARKLDDLGSASDKALPEIEQLDRNAAETKLVDG